MGRAARRRRELKARSYRGGEIAGGSEVTWLEARAIVRKPKLMYHITSVVLIASQNLQQREYPSSRVRNMCTSEK